MPIYEFYCPACHVIFNFYSWKVDTETTPACPRCRGKKMSRQVSRFSVTGRAREPAAGPGEPHLDESRMEKAMSALEREAAGLNEEDPKQAARLMRKLTEMTGMELAERLADEAHELSRRVVFLTGGAFTDRARTFVAFTRAPVVEKPFEQGQLKRSVDQVLRGP